MGDRTAPAPTYGSRLLGDATLTPRQLRRRVQVLLTVSIVFANVVGTLCLVALLTWVVPLPADIGTATIVANAIAVPVYVVFAVTVGVVWGTRATARRLRWVVEDRAPEADEQRETLRAPLRLVRTQAWLWAGAVVVFTVLNGVIEPEMIANVLLTVAMVGAVTVATTYLDSEFVLRPIAARALAHDTPEGVTLPGLTARSVLAWVLGSAFPVVGLMTIAIFGLAQADVSVQELGVAVLVLGGLTLAVGLLLTLMAARAAVDPVRDLREAVARVERGDLETEVAVYDASELGRLQAGFNRMLAGLRERERLADLFGRHVGEDVARAALEQAPELGGELRTVGVLFVDVIGSTRLAATRAPTEVVALLNRFFAVIVDEVARHGGLVNKFEGDAALAVFGAPTAHADPAGAALACARVVDARLRAEVDECDAAIGVAAGPVVAGNVGAEARFEYTVIGDPVNEAARLTELAKTRPGRVAASAEAVAAAAPDEARRWSVQEWVVLRGRERASGVAEPTGTPEPTGDHGTGADAGEATARFAAQVARPLD